MLCFSNKKNHLCKCDVRSSIIVIVNNLIITSTMAKKIKVHYIYAVFDLLFVFASTRRN